MLCYIGPIHSDSQFGFWVSLLSFDSIALSALMRRSFSTKNKTQNLNVR